MECSSQFAPLDRRRHRLFGLGTFHGNDLGLVLSGSTVFSSAVTVIFTTAHLGAPKLKLCLIPAELREGFYFGAGLSAQTIYNDIDKAMLTRLSSLDAAGIYSALIG